jgi:hypothetical protein
MSCELVCTGWYSSGVPRSYVTFGDEEVRSNAFRPLWWQSLENFVNPQQVLVVDSASPIKPNDEYYTTTKIKTIELLKNPGHSQNCTTHYCGYMASVIVGLEFALLNDVDYFLYIEQDALIYGKGFLEGIKKSLLKSDYVFGNGGGNEIEQSVFALSKNGIRKFLSALHSIEITDKLVSPELKFMYAASCLSGFPFIHLLAWDQPRLIKRPSMKLFFKVIPLFRKYGTLPFGYGRVRPINFTDEIFYFQQGSREEIDAYRLLTGFNLTQLNIAPQSTQNSVIE